MARTRITLKRFVADLSGYTQIKDLDGVQSLLTPKAEAVRAAADRLSGGKHSVQHKRGKYDMGYFVRTENSGARRAQGKHKTLTKALNSTNGGG